jgi:hypothetical protein
VKEARRLPPGFSPNGILKPLSQEPRAAADGEETAGVLSWHTHARRVRAADVRLWSLHLQIVMGVIRWKPIKEILTTGHGGRRGRKTNPFFVFLCVPLCPLGRYCD